jgi:hypothetical protein
MFHDLADGVVVQQVGTGGNAAFDELPIEHIVVKVKRNTFTPAIFGTILVDEWALS